MFRQIAEMSEKSEWTACKGPLFFKSKRIVGRVL